MRNLILAVAAVAGVSALASGSAAARSAYPYCMTSQAFGTDCSYPSYEACQATANGLGYDCIANPAAAYDTRPYGEPRRSWRVYGY